MSTSHLNADLTGCYYETYQCTATDFAGNEITCQVADLYMTTDDLSDLILNVFNFDVSNSLGVENYYQSMTGVGWTPSLEVGIFNTEATRELDSFVTIGAQSHDLSMDYSDTGRPTQPNANGTMVDPNFGPLNSDEPGMNAGWFNSNPNNTIGHPDFTCMLPGPLAEQASIFIGRFAIQAERAFTLSGSIGVCFYQGLGTSAKCVDLNIQQAPAPGTLALLGLASLVARSRSKIPK